MYRLKHFEFGDTVLYLSELEPFTALNESPGVNKVFPLAASPAAPHPLQGAVYLQELKTRVGYAHFHDRAMNN